MTAVALTLVFVGVVLWLAGYAQLTTNRERLRAWQPDIDKLPAPLRTAVEQDHSACLLLGFGFFIAGPGVLFLVAGVILL